MANTKTELKFFTVAQYGEEAAYLSAMHKRGWKLTKITFPCFYHFEECTPENVVYQLDYNQEGVKSKGEYIQMFTDCGWSYLFDFVGYSYFYKTASEMKGNEEIFCDDESRLDMMRRVFKGRMLPLIAIFFLCILPQLFMNTHGYGGGSSVQHSLSVIFYIMFIVYDILFISFGTQYYSYYNKIYGSENGSKVKYYGFLSLMIVLIVGVSGFYFISY